MLAGGLMIGLAAPFFDGTALPMVTAIMLCALCAFILARRVLSKTAIAGQAAE